jgi:ribonuclease G
LSKTVWLKSGAYLVIEYTEAMTVIDVNTGKADKRACREDTFLKINIEAAKEIIRQLMIRNVSGIIVVDFINMESKTGYKKLIDCLREYSMYDYSVCTVLDVTALGLVEITRKKVEKPLYEIYKI